LPYPDDNSADYRINAQTSHNLRLIAINRSEVDSIGRVAELNPSSIDNLCNGARTQVTGVGYYNFTCNPDDVREHHAWVVGSITSSTASFNTTSIREANALYVNTYNTPRCWDTDAGALAAD